jgi:MFS family permease
MSAAARSPEHVANPYAILGNRNLSFYLTGRFMASFGQQMLTVAIGWELYQRTHSALAMMLVGLAAFLPMVAMTLPAGHMADSRDRKKIIVLMQGALALISLGLALVSHQKFPVGWMYVCLLLAGICRTFLWSASASFLPQLVQREEFPLAVNWSSTTYQFSSMAGPAAGGALIAWTNSPVTVYLANALTAFFCLLMISLVQAQHKPSPRREVSLDSLLGGFRFVFAHRIILGAITLDLFAVLFGGATGLLPQYAADILKVGPAGLGLLTAALPVGSMVCAVLMAHRPPLQKAGRALIVAVIVFGVATIAFGVSRSYWFSVAMLFVSGFADNISVIVRHTLVQLLTPDSMRGRVSSVNNLFIGTSNELGWAESNLVSQYLGPVFSVVSGGVATVLVVMGVAWLWPEIPKFGRLVQPQAPLPPSVTPDPGEVPQE